MWLAIIVGAAVMIRLFLASFPPFKTDMDSFIAWGEQMLAVGPGQFYTSGIWSDYAPGYMYFMWAVAAIKQFIFPEASRELYEFLHKSVPMIFDILTGILLYKTMRLIARRHHTGETIRTYFLPEIVSAIYLFSPFTFFTSSVWGQVDSVYVFFLLLSFYYIIKANLPLACVIYVIAAVIKPQSVILAPLYILLFIQKQSLLLFVKSAAVSIATFYILTLPFFGLSALSGMWTLLSGSVEVYPYSSINTFNYWGTMGFWKPDDVQYLFGATARQFGYIAWGITLCFGFFFGVKHLYKKEKFDEKNGALLATFFILSAVMFMTRMHERYLFPLFVYFVLAAGIYTYRYLLKKGEVRLSPYPVIILWTLFFVTMLLHSINLYYVYVYYQYFSQEPRINVPVENKFYYFVETFINTWSYIQLVVYVIFVISLPYYLKKQEDYEEIY